MASGSAEAAQWWREACERVCTLVEQAVDDDPGALERPVPACPDWSGRQLLAHMVGLTADVLDGDEPDDHNEAWTQAQVDRRARDDAATIVAEWRRLAPAVVAYVRETDARPLGDVTIHEHDLRGALGRPGARDVAAVGVIRERMAARLAARVTGAGLAPVRLASPEWSWSSADGEPGVVLEAPGFDLFRAVTSRRTADQLRAWTTQGDVEPYLDAFAVLGPLPGRSLGE
ncbi:maleylpyruvate isomerase family mycothiol-dependent enzyme [Nocardioides marinquilinus]|uniref:Maleylpyruvate isomerase family mycothiol-dependent enzyme n=1 Tax=Nocardioides marinquilinus TaxID=1210400 RepID=A0ABP9PLT8_9ACTN